VKLSNRYIRNNPRIETGDVKFPNIFTQ